MKFIDIDEVFVVEYKSESGDTNKYYPDLQVVAVAGDEYFVHPKVYAGKFGALENAKDFMEAIDDRREINIHVWVNIEEIGRRV